MLIRICRTYNLYNLETPRGEGQSFDGIMWIYQHTCTNTCKIYWKTENCQLRRAQSLYWWYICSSRVSNSWLIYSLKFTNQKKTQTGLKSVLIYGHFRHVHRYSVWHRSMTLTITNPPPPPPPAFSNCLNESLRVAWSV